MKLAVYCVHVWRGHGPGVLRCHICTALWYKFKDHKPPKTVIGYVAEDDEDHGSDQT